MKLLFDLFPVILFFISFKYAEQHREAAAGLVGTLLGSAAISLQQAPILLSTVVVIAATVAQIAWVHFRHGKVDKMLWVSLVLVVVFGGLTLLFQDEAFIKWKPTLLYWVFAGSMAFAVFILGKNPLKGMLGEQLQLPEPVWRKLNLAWITFFLAMGGLNLLIAFHNPWCVGEEACTAQWVNFKLFGGMGFTLAFVLVQGLMLSKYIEEK